MNTSCCRKHVKGGEATSNTKIVANIPATIVIIANIIDQTFMIFCPVRESALTGKKSEKWKKQTKAASFWLKQFLFSESVHKRLF